MMRLTLLAVTIVCAAMRPACGFHQEELRLPTAAAGPAGLEALLIRPSGAPMSWRAGGLRRWW
jgi:hypothetical protein